MAYKPPTSYTVMKAMTINKIAYAKNQAISVAEVRKLHNANGLVSRGWIKPTPDPHRRRGGVVGKWRSGPTTVHVALQQGPNIS